MALSNQDRVLESSVTTGTGAYTLAGAVTGFQSFAIVGNGNTCFYSAYEVDASGNPSGGWENGLGTYTASGTTLARTTIYTSSNSNNAVNWSSGTRYIACAPLTEGTLIVRQPGGTVGTDEVQIYANGSDIFYDSMESGSAHIFRSPNSGASDDLFIVKDASNNVFLQLGSNSTFLVRGTISSVIGAAYNINTNGFVYAENGHASPATGPDVSLYRVAAGVWGVGSGGSSGDMWLQNRGGVAQLDANFTATTTTMANTNLSRTVIAGRSYAFRLLLPINNATAGDGFKCDFDGGTYILTIKQDGTGNRTLAWNAAYKFPSAAGDPVLSTGANDLDIVTFVSDGTYMYGVFQADFV